MLNTLYRENEQILNSVEDSFPSQKRFPLQKNDTSKSCPLALHRIPIYQTETHQSEGFKNQIWKDNAFTILTLIIRFINAIIKKPFSQQFSKINSKLFDIIGDSASDFLFYETNNYFKKNKPLIIKFCNICDKNLIKNIKSSKLLQTINCNQFLLKPESICLLIWNLYVLLMLNLMLFYVSVKFAFQIDSRQSEYEIYRYSMFYLLPIISFVLDVIIRLNTSFYEKGELIQDREKIAKHYLKTGLVIDIGVLLSQIFNLYAGIKHLDLIMLIKIIQIPTLSEHLLDSLELASQHFAIYDLTKLCYFIIVETHLVCCGWYYIGSLNEEESWLVTLRIQNTDWLVQYFHSFYWSLITMTTIGYGDITPQNLQERVYVIFIALISCCTFGYSISSIGQVFGQLSKKRNQLRIDLNSLKRYLRQKEYNPELQVKVLRYFEYIWSDEIIENAANLQSIQNQLPHQLKNEMIIDLNIRILNEVPFLTNKFSKQFLSNLSLKFFEEKFGPQQQIFEKDTACHWLYILLSGSVDLYIELPDREIKKIVSLQLINRQFEVFGQREFFSGSFYAYSCRAMNQARCLKIKKQDFVEIAERYGYEQYCEIKDILQQTGRNRELQTFCSGCNKETHMINQCPLITGFPNKQKVIIQYKRSNRQERFYSQRKNLPRRMNALKNQGDVSDSVLCYLLQDSTLRQQVGKQYKISKLEFKLSQLEQLSPRQKHRNLERIFQQFPRPAFLKELSQLAKHQYNNENAENLDNYAAYQKISDEVSESEQFKIKTDIEKQGKYKLKADSFQQHQHNRVEFRSIIKTSGKNEDSSDIFTRKEKSRLLAESIKIIEKNGSSLRNELWNEMDLDNEQQSYYPKPNDHGGIKMGKYQEIYDEFEKMKDYQYYLPHMNLQVILEKINEKLHKNSLYRFLNQNFSSKNHKQVRLMRKH